MVYVEGAGQLCVDVMASKLASVSRKQEERLWRRGVAMRWMTRREISGHSGALARLVPIAQPGSEQLCRADFTFRMLQAMIALARNISRL